MRATAVCLRTVGLQLGDARDALDQHGGEVVFLWSSSCESQNRLVEFRDDDFGLAIAVLVDYLDETVSAKLFAVLVFPLEKVRLRLSQKLTRPSPCCPSNRKHGFVWLLRCGNDLRSLFACEVGRTLGRP